MAESINQVILNFLDRMIDESAKSTEALSSLRSVVTEYRSEQKESSSDLREKIEDVQHQFSNGFKSEIKNHVTFEGKNTQDVLGELSKRLETEEEKKRRLEHYDRFAKFLDRISSPKFWATLFVSFVVAVATLLTAINTAWSTIKPFFDKKSTAIVQPHSGNVPVATNPTTN